MKTIANPPQDEKLLEIEVYTQAAVQTGRVSCPATARILDLLNNQLFLDSTGEDSFLEVIESTAPAGKDTPRLYIRKSAIQLMAATDANVGRGVGAYSTRITYPFVCKVPARVSIQLHHYSVVGNAHCSGDQCLMALLNERKAFLPLTEVVITDKAGISSERPFAAINKYQIISLR